MTFWIESDSRSVHCQHVLSVLGGPVGVTPPQLGRYGLCFWCSLAGCNDRRINIFSGWLQGQFRKMSQPLRSSRIDCIMKKKILRPEEIAAAQGDVGKALKALGKGEIRDTWKPPGEWQKWHDESTDYSRETLLKKAAKLRAVMAANNEA